MKHVHRHVFIMLLSPSLERVLPVLFRCWLACALKASALKTSALKASVFQASAYECLGSKGSGSKGSPALKAPALKASALKASASKAARHTFRHAMSPESHPLLENIDGRQWIVDTYSDAHKYLVERAFSTDDIELVSESCCSEMWNDGQMIGEHRSRGHLRREACTPAYWEVMATSACVVRRRWCPFFIFFTDMALPT